MKAKRDGQNTSTGGILKLSLAFMILEILAVSGNSYLFPASVR